MLGCQRLHCIHAGVRLDTDRVNLGEAKWFRTKAAPAGVTAAAACICSRAGKVV